MSYESDLRDQEEPDLDPTGPAHSRKPCLVRPATAGLHKEPMAPVILDLHEKWGKEKPLEEHEMHAVLYAQGVWHGADIFLSPLKFEFKVMAMALHAQFKEQPFLLSEGRHCKAATVLQVADWVKKLDNFFRFLVCMDVCVSHVYQ